MCVQQHCQSIVLIDGKWSDVCNNLSMRICMTALSIDCIDRRKVNWCACKNVSVHVLYACMNQNSIKSLMNSVAIGKEHVFHRANSAPYFRAPHSSSVHHGAVYPPTTTIHSTWSNGVKKSARNTASRHPSTINSQNLFTCCLVVPWD